MTTAQIGKLAGEKNEMAVQSALYLLERAGHISREGHAIARGARGPRAPRTIVILDNVPVAALRVDSRQIIGRADLERRKLREMINLCYTDYCYRAHILNYFGDRNHDRQCGTCGNCAPKPETSIPDADLDHSRPSPIQNHALLPATNCCAFVKSLPALNA